MYVEISDTWADGEKVRDYGSVLRLLSKNEILLEEADTMEPEDVSFSRDLSWIKPALELAYTLGKEDNGS